MILVMATHNKGKAEEIAAFFKPLGYEIRTLADYGITGEPEENGESFIENARIKARAALAAAGEICFADDSGLCVDALDGLPGLHSARYGGCKNDQERNELLLEKLQGEKNRSARFVCAIVCVFPDGREISTVGECIGEILETPKGRNGFGYDPLFYLPELGCSMAEIDQEKKLGLSHRGRALRKFTDMLKSL